MTINSIVKHLLIVAATLGAVDFMFWSMMGDKLYFLLAVIPAEVSAVFIILHLIQKRIRNK